MSKMIPIPVTAGFEERWAAWQARGVEYDLARRRRLFLLIAGVILSGAVLSGLGWTL